MKRWHRMRDDDQPYRGSLCSEIVQGWVTTDDERVNCVGCLQQMRDVAMELGKERGLEAEELAKQSDAAFTEATACYARATMFSERAIEILQHALAEANAAIPEEARNRA